MAGQLIDETVAKGAPADLKASLGFPLPVWVICDMLGVPDSDRGGSRTGRTRCRA